MPIRLPLYRGMVTTWGELRDLGEAAEGVKFNLQGDGDHQAANDPNQAYWTVRGGQAVRVAVGTPWARLDNQPIVIIVPHSGPWNPAVEIFPPVGTVISVSVLAAWGPHANGLYLKHPGERATGVGGEGLHWRLEWTPPQPELDLRGCWCFHHAWRGAEPGRAEFVDVANYSYEILAHPSERWQPPSATQPTPVSESEPGCPVCRRKDVFYDEYSGRLMKWAPRRNMYSHFKVAGDRRSGDCAGKHFHSAVKDMFKCFAMCPRCDRACWRSDLQSNQCSDCRSRRGKMQKSGGMPDQFRFGAELETEGIHFNRQAGDIAARRKGWKAKSDGSLRGNHAEVTTPPTWFTEYGIKEFQNTVRELRRAGARATQRCGGHVHVGLEDLTYSQLASIIEWWWLMEPTIFAAIPPWPGRSNYCRRLSESARRNALAYLNEHNRAAMGGVMDGRYSALNTTSLGKYGTFEFRLFNGTVHAVKAVANVALAVHVVSHASRNVIKPMQTEIPLFTPDRAGMLSLLDTIEIKEPAWRWHLLGQFQTEEDRPHGPRQDLKELAEKKRNIPPTPRRIGNRAVILTLNEYFALGLTQCRYLESTYENFAFYANNMAERVNAAAERIEDNPSLSDYTVRVPIRGEYSGNMLVAVTYREWDRAVQAQEAAARNARINNTQATVNGPF